MTQSPNQARQPQNWLNLAQFALWITSVLALLAAIAIQPLLAVLLPVVMAMGLNLWQARQARAENRRDRQVLHQGINRAILELEEQLQEQDGQIQELTETLTHFRPENSQYAQDLQATRQALETAINRLETEVEGLIAKINPIPDLELFQGQIATLQRENKALSQQSETWQTAIATLQQNFHDLSPIPDRLAALSQALVSLEANFAENRQAVGQLSEINENIANLQGLHAQFQDSSNRQTQTFQTAIAQIEQRNQDYLKLFQQTEALRATIGHFEHRLQRINQNGVSSSSASDLTPVYEQLQQISSRVASLQAQFDRRLQPEDLVSLEAAISSLENQQSEVRNAIAKVNQKNKQLKSQVATQLQQLHRRFNSLQLSLGELTQLRDAIASRENQPVTTATQWQLLYQFNSDSSGNALAIAPNNKIFAGDTNDYKIKTWNLQTHQEIRTLSGHKYHIAALDFSPDSRLLASGAFDKVIKIWEMETGQVKHQLEGHSQAICAIAFSRDGKKFASGSKDNTVKLWDTKTGETLKTLTGHWGQINAIAFSPDGITFASGSAIGTAKIWNIESGELIKDCLLASPIYDLAYSRDNRILYAACENKTIKRLNTKTGKQHPPLTGHSDAVLSVTISPNGTTAASSSSDGTIKLWSLVSGEEIAELQREDTTIYKVRFSADGRNLVSLCEGGLIQVWSVI